MPVSHAIDKFSRHLFWDVDASGLSMQGQKKFIIKRVLEYGLLEDWLVIVHYYGKAGILQVATELRSLDSKALSFIATYGGVSKEKFRCYTTRQSMPLHWNS
jgi:hypothetical protein